MKKILKIFLILFMFSTVTVYADSNNLFRADDSLLINEDLNGTSFLAGNSVTTENRVDGILVAAGNLMNINGESDYSFIAGNTININRATFKDGFIAGSSIDIKSSEIKRDLYAAGEKITLTSDVGRNAYLGGENIVIDSRVYGDLYIAADNITINSNAVIKGKLKYNEDAKINISKDASINEKETYKDVNVKVEVNPVTKIVNKITNSLLSFFNMLVIGLFMVLLIPRLFKKLKELNNDKLLPAFGFGVLILIALPIAAIMVMFTVVGISTGIIALVLYGLMAYLSTILSTYKLSQLAFGNKIKNDYLLLLVGLAIVYVIKLIPFVGGLVSFALLCLGLGLSVSIYKRK